MLRPVLVSPPSSAPVSVAEAKLHLRCDFDDDDALISSYIDAAVAHLDGYAGVLGRCLVSQNWRQDFGTWPASRCLRLPFPDTATVVVKYSDVNDAEQTVAAGLYDVQEDERSAFIRFKDGFTRPPVFSDRLDPIRITFDAGYGAAADVPSALRSAVLLLAGHFYQNREAVTAVRVELPLGVAALIAPYRRVGV